MSPACLGWDQTIKVPDHTFVVSGWGRTNNDGSDLGDFKTAGAHSSKLLKLIVPRIPLDKCKADFPIFEDLPEKVFCAGGEEGKLSFMNFCNSIFCLIKYYFHFKKSNHKESLNCLYAEKILFFKGNLFSEDITSEFQFYCPYILKNVKEQ